MIEITEKIAKYSIYNGRYISTIYIYIYVINTIDIYTVYLHMYKCKNPKIMPFISHYLVTQRVSLL